MDHQRRSLSRSRVDAAVRSVALSVLLLAVPVHPAWGAVGDPIPGVDVSLEQVPGGNVAAVVPCENPNTTTESGYPACAPAMTYHQDAGSPPSGWLFGKGVKSKLQMKPAKSNKVVHPLNPPGGTDLNIQFALKGVRDAGGLANSSGALGLVVRLSIDDRVGGSMTLADLPLSVAFELTGGKTKVKTSLNVLLNDLGHPSLPAGFVMQLVDWAIVDPNGIVFGVPGASIQIDDEGQQ